MPGGDRTGPAGLGPMTGRAAGYCAGYAVPGFANPAPGRGFGGRGRGLGGGGRGRRNWFYATGLPGWQRFGMGYPTYGGVAPYGDPQNSAVSQEQELNALKNQAEYFEKALDEIKKRITEMEAESQTP